MRISWPLRAIPQAAAEAGPAALRLAATGVGAGEGQGEREGRGSGRGPGPAGAPGAAEQDLATALGLPAAALAAPAPEPDPEEEAAAGLVRLHLLANRPEASAFPRVAMRLLELLLEEEVDVGELRRLVELDAALTGAVLARANSAQARALDPIEDVPHALTRLGLTEVARVAAGAAMRTLYDGRGHAAFSTFAPLWTLLFRHAVTSARLSAELGRGEVPGGADLAYTAGLLHDVGLAVGLRSLAALTQDGSLPQREPGSALRILWRVHRELGAEAGRGWRLPPRLLEVVARHHADPAGAPVLVRLVALSSALDLLAAPGLAEAASRQALAAARALSATPAWLAAAVARREDAAAWAERAFSSL